MQLYDRATIKGKARITPEGYLVADALVARANNIQDYRAHELSLTDRDPNDIVRVFRPEAVVFHRDTLKTASRLPITIDHPRGIVDAKTYKELSHGETGEEILRDGEFMRVPIRVTDADGVEAVRTTHQEFSLGYGGELDLTAGVHDGQPYDASLKSISYNHLAACRAARGGSNLRIVDERTPAEKPAMKIKIGDAEVDLNDTAQTAHAIGIQSAALKDAQTQVGTLTAELATANTSIQAKDGEIAGLKSKLADAEVTPAKLQQLADARAKVITDARKIAGAALVVDGKTDAEIRKAAVLAKLGDSAKDMADAAIEGAFVALVPVGDAQADPLRTVISGQPIVMGDAQADYATAQAKRKAELRDAWRQPAAANAA